MATYAYLVNEVRNGNEEMERVLFIKSFPMLWGTAKKRTGDADLATKIPLEAWQEIVKKINSLQDPADYSKAACEIIVKQCDAAMKSDIQVSEEGEKARKWIKTYLENKPLDSSSARRRLLWEINMDIWGGQLSL